MNQSKLIRMNETIRSICDHLVERNAILFLGAGINAGVVNDKDESFPLGRDLGEWIARDLLLTPALQVSLEECAEMARFSLGEKALNDYLYDKLTAFKPGAAHLALVQLPWDVAYTTNYDLLASGVHPSCHHRCGNLSSNRFDGNKPGGFLRRGYPLLQASRNRRSRQHGGR